MIKNIIIYGGGRWSKIWFNVITKTISKDINILIISGRGYDSYVNFLMATSSRHNVTLFRDPPPVLPTNSIAIVANSADDHFQVASTLLNLRIPTLVEKPFAMNLKQIQSLIELSEASKTIIAPAHVFKFPKYLLNFKNYVSKKESPLEVNIDWSDADGEVSHGFHKSYDATISVFHDCMPHIVSLIEVIFDTSPSFKRVLNIENGGAKVTFQLSVDGLNCNVLLHRNAQFRTRKISLNYRNDKVVLDFTSEPGNILEDGYNFCADNNWGNESSPLQKMIQEFIRFVTNENVSNKFGLQTAITSCKISEQINAVYQNNMAQEIQKILKTKHISTKDSVYAIREFFKIDREFFSMNILKKIIYLKRNHKNLSIRSLIIIAKAIN